MKSAIIDLYSNSHSLLWWGTNVHLKCAQPDAPRILSLFSFEDMNLFLSASAHRASVERDSGNGSNMPLKEPCVDYLVFAPFHLITLVFTVSILSLVLAAKTIPCVVCFALAKILIANFTAGLEILVIALTRVIVTIVRCFSLTDGPCRFLIAFVSVGGTSKPLMMALFMPLLSLSSSVLWSSSFRSSACYNNVAGVYRI